MSKQPVPPLVEVSLQSIRNASLSIIREMLREHHMEMLIDTALQGDEFRGLSEAERVEAVTTLKMQFGQ